MTAPDELHVPTKLRRGAKRAREDESIESAVWLIQHMCEHLGLENLGDTELLDFGCGVKFTQALINRALPIKKYVGVDVDREMITFLRENVHDPRFEYFHIDAHNELYNPGGEVLTADTKLPIDGRLFDVISLFSVFTHLAPHDYRTMLRLLRRYVKPNGRLFYTVYINELTEGGHGLMDGWVSAYREKHPEAPPLATTKPFTDLDPDQPLKWAVYSESYARELTQGTGWEVVGLSPPDVDIQHHFICAPKSTPSGLRLALERGGRTQR
jgi:SAM-dependent methyltransferase